MEMNLGYAGPPGQSSVKFWPIYLCFIIFGISIPFSKPEPGVITFLLSVLLALVIGLLAVNILIMLLNSSNKTLVQKAEASLPAKQLARACCL